MAAKPAILSLGKMQKAVNDPKFYQSLPEFNQLRPKLKTMRAQVRKGGCGGCRKRAIANSLFRDFMFVVQSLDQDGQARLRNYYGVESLIVGRQNTKTKRFENKLI